MSSVNFENVKLVIADGGAQIRREVKALLHHQGFRDIVETGDIQVLRDAIRLNEVDLLIADADLPSGDVCGLTKEIRHNEIGDNPFIVVMTLVQDPDEDRIREIIDSGSDDLILKPITTGTMIKRVLNMMSERKKFVVTSDYIGPTRRQKARVGAEEVEQMDVPNPFRARAVGGVELDMLQEEVDQFRGVVNEQKMERNASQIVYLVDRLLPIYDREKVKKKDVLEQIDRLKFITEDTARRLRGTTYDHIGQLCNSMVDVVKTIRAKPTKPPNRDLRLLPELARAIETSFRSEENLALARELSESLQQRHAR